MFFLQPQKPRRFIYFKTTGTIAQIRAGAGAGTQLIAEEAKDKKWQQIIHEINEEIRRGKSFSSAISQKKQVFPTDFTNLIRAGETSGNLASALERLADLFQRRAKIAQKVSSALIYPAILFIMAICSVSVILTVVLPQFEPLFADAHAVLPLPTRMVISSSHVVREFWWVWACLAGGAVFLWDHIKRSPSLLFSRDKSLLRIPIGGALLLYSDIIQLARTLGVLMQSGIPLGNGLPVACEGMKNHFLRQRMEAVAISIRDGQSFSVLLARENYFPKLMLNMVQIGEETGKLEDMLFEIADSYEDEMQQTIDRMLALLVPTLTIVMGLLIAFLVSAMLLAMLSINDLAI